MDILLISVARSVAKKSHDDAILASMQFNYGLLALASHIVACGYTARIIDTQSTQQDEPSSFIVNTIEKIQPKSIGLSCISGYSYERTLEIARIIKGHFPAIPIITGGQDHVGRLASTVLNECPAIDAVVIGEGEAPVTEILYAIKNGTPIAEWRFPNVCTRSHLSPSLTEPTDPNYPIDFDLYENVPQYPPAIEIGRGCSFNCEFCSNSPRAAYKKNPEIIVKEVATLVKIHHKNDLQVYFETPNFMMSDEELLQLKKLRNDQSLIFTWRTQARADTLTSARLLSMKNAGLGALDIGFESASPHMLKKMKKTRSPEQYLSCAASLLAAAKELGIHTKINILFYIGETKQSLSDTVAFLVDNAPHIQAISAYPVVGYPGGTFLKDISSDLERAGGCMVTSTDWQKRHLTQFNLSSDISHACAQKLSLSFGKAFQTLETYYKDRSFGYFRPSLSYDEFLTAAVPKIDDIPCSIDDHSMHAARTALSHFLSTPVIKSETDG